MPEPVKITKEHVGKTMFIPMELFPGGVQEQLDSGVVHLSRHAYEVLILESLGSGALYYIPRKVSPHAMVSGASASLIYLIGEDTEIYETRHDAILSQVEAGRAKVGREYRALVMIENAALKEAKEWALSAVDKLDIPLRTDKPEAPNRDDLPTVFSEKLMLPYPVTLRDGSEGHITSKITCSDSRFYDIEFVDRTTAEKSTYRITRNGSTSKVSFNPLPKDIVCLGWESMLGSKKE